MQLSGDEFRLMRDVLVVSYARLMGPAPEILTDLVRKGAIVWEWNGGIPIYKITDAGREAMRANQQKSGRKKKARRSGCNR